MNQLQFVVVITFAFDWGRACYTFTRLVMRRKVEFRRYYIYSRLEVCNLEICANTGGYLYIFPGSNANVTKKLESCFVINLFCSISYITYVLNRKINFNFIKYSLFGHIYIYMSIKCLSDSNMTLIKIFILLLIVKFGK